MTILTWLFAAVSLALLCAACILFASIYRAVVELPLLMQSLRHYIDQKTAKETERLWNRAEKALDRSLTG